MVELISNYKFETWCVVWVLFLIYLLIRYLIFSERKPNLDKILIVVFFLDLATFFPMILENEGAFSISSSFIYVLRIFGMEMSFSEFIEEVKAYNSFIAYQWLSALLYALSPILAGAFILSFIKDKYKSIQISLSLSRRMYIFTELNDRSLAIAKTISKKGSKIIFLDSLNEEDTQLKEKCRLNGYMLIDYSVERVYEKIKKHLFNRISKLNINKEATIFFIDQNEDKALDKAITFIESVMNNKRQIKTSLFLFSVSDEAELIVDNYKSEFTNKKIGEVTLRLIDSAQIISYQVLENYPLYQMESGMLDKGFNVTIIGTGNIGTHITKDVIWCGQTQNTSLRINIIENKTSEDSCGQAQGEFEYRFPELTTDLYNINYYYANMSLKEFDETLLDDLSESNYFVIALDDDEKNIMIAHNIRMKYYRMYHKLPVIVAVVTDDDKCRAIKDVFEKLKINIVGMNSEIYSMKSILSNPIYVKAYLTDCAYNSKKEYTNKTFEQFLNMKEADIRSNIAYAIHIDYKLWDITGLNPSVAKESPERLKSKFYGMSIKEKQKLNEFEHVRWMTFQRSEGWVSPFREDDFESIDSIRNAMEVYKTTNHQNILCRVDYEQGENPDKFKLHKSMFSKQHGCIIDYKYLELLAEVMGENKDEFTDYDKTLNEEMLNIWLKYVEENNNV